MKTHPLGTLFISVVGFYHNPTVYEVIGSSQIGKKPATYLLKYSLKQFERDDTEIVEVKKKFTASELKKFKIITQEIRDQIMIVNKAERKYKIEKYQLNKLLRS